MKRIFALMLALIMVLSLSVTAFAAEVDPLATETIAVAGDDTHSYAVYQIFTGELSGDELINVELGQNGVLPEGTSLSEALIALEALKDSTDYKAIIAEATKYVNLNSTPIDTISASKSVDVKPGYYLMKDLGALDEGEGYSLYVLKVVRDITVTPKRGKVTSEKKVDDVNDSTGNVQQNQDSADYDIGDDVPFTLTGVLPEDYANYTTYYLAFHDKCAPGLTFKPETVEVFVDGTKITTGYEVKTTGLTDDCTFEVIIAEAKDITSIKAQSVVTVTYKATLNDSAALGYAGNENSMKLEFSNDPNYVGGGQPDGETPPPPTGFTPEDKVVVFTYKVIVNKVNENNEALVGATFTLYKELKNAPDTGTVGTDYIVEGEGTTARYWKVLGSIEGTQLSTFTWSGIDDGNYRLVETVTPDGYNTIDPIEFTVEATHNLDSADPHLLTLTGGTFTGDINTGTLTADVENRPGAVLPSTGGIGTTIFYLAGGILVLAAVVMLVTKKRMASAE